MKLHWISSGLIAVCLLGSAELRSQEPTVLTVVEDVNVTGVKRLGINVGSRNRWGAAQILRNLIDNPGFEAGEMGMVALADIGSTAGTFRQAYWDPASGGHPVGFWDGAEFEIVYGAAAGRQGSIDQFRHEDGAYVFKLSDDGNVPAAGDVMFVRKKIAGRSGNNALADPSQSRPGSPGTQSLRLQSDGTDQWTFYMDSYWRDGDRSIGKMLPVRGGWRVAVWARGATGGEQARIQFFREGEANFLDETVTLTDEWQLYEWEFSVADGTDPVGEYGPDDYRPILGFRLQAADGSVWFDDVELARADQQNPTVFTDLFVQRLKELKPGILRDWSNQLGSTLDNQLAEPWGRRTNGYKPGSGAGSYAYSLHEFLELAKEVGAEPWYVVPPTFSPDDLKNLAEYLSAPAQEEYPYAMRRAELGQSEPWTSVFRTVHLEFGNELWGGADPGDPFQGASLRGGVRLGAIASDRFGILKTSPFYDEQQFNMIIGGQAGYVGRQQEIEANASEHDMVALAPYFGILDTWNSDQEIFAPLLAGPAYQAGSGGAVRKSFQYLQDGGNDTRMGIYEINFHTTGGNAPIDVRNDFVTGAAGALVLPLAMLTYQRDFGAVNQAAFSSLGYSYRMGNGDYVRVWGMLRDLYSTGLKRPTWLGLELVNKAIPEQYSPFYPEEWLVSKRVEVSGANPVWGQDAINGIGERTDVPVIQAFAFRAEDGIGAEFRYGVVVFNLDPENAREIVVRTRDEYLNEGSLYFTTRFDMYSIASESLHADNELDEQVVIDSVSLEHQDLHEGVSFTLPPGSVHVLRYDVEFGDGVEEAGDENRPELRVVTHAGGAETVQYTLPSSGPVMLDVLDLSGRVVARLTDREMTEGRHVVRLRDIPGEPLPSGLYFLRLQTGGEVLVRKFPVSR